MINLKYITIIILLILFESSCSTLSSSQTGTAYLHSIHKMDLKGRACIIGRLMDSKSGKPLVNASVLVRGTDRGNLTDQDGNYVITDIPTGIYTVKAFVVGYQSYELVGLNLTDNSVAVLDFKLVPQETMDLEVY